MCRLVALPSVASFAPHKTSRYLHHGLTRTRSYIPTRSFNLKLDVTSIDLYAKLKASISLQEHPSDVINCRETAGFPKSLVMFDATFSRFLTRRTIQSYRKLLSAAWTYSVFLFSSFSLAKPSPWNKVLQDGELQDMMEKMSHPQPHRS